MPKEFPKRAAYKAAEVCEIAQIQPYVLRSWESEFPKLGVLRSGTRVYRQTDVEQVLRIKELVFEEGLTLSGARRRIEEEHGPALDELPIEEFVTPEMRQRIGLVKDGLRQVLTMLGPPQMTGEAAVGDRAAAPAGEQRPAFSRGKRALKTPPKGASRHGPAKSGGNGRASKRRHS
jgi:DNA-binding transcriptional MerR regulator